MDLMKDGQKIFFFLRRGVKFFPSLGDPLISWILLGIHWESLWKSKLQHFGFDVFLVACGDREEEVVWVRGCIV